MEAELLLGLLRQFPGYTLGSLRAEGANLLRLVNIEARGTPEPEESFDTDLEWT